MFEHAAKIASFVIFVFLCEYFGDAVRILDKEGQFHECLLKEIQ